MSLVENFRAVLTNILANKFRVVLTALGIVAGSLSIILVVAIARGGEATMRQQFGRLSVEGIFVSTTVSRTVLDEHILLEIQKAPAIRDATMTLIGRSQVTLQKKAMSNVLVAGVMDNYRELHALELQHGDFISVTDNEHRNRVAVLGAEIAKELFDQQLAQSSATFISIDGGKYEVVGVLEPVGEPLMGLDVDNTVFAPYQAMAKYTYGNRNLRPTIQAFANDILNVHLGVAQIESLLRINYSAPASDFRVRDVGRSLETTQDIIRLGTTLLLSAAVIVLIVAGIGIMNVLFVSVKERTREIGLLKALGAKQKDILLQFLLESILISVVGGVIGALLSFPIIPLLKYLSVNLKPTPSVYGIFIGMLFSVFTGTVFGYYPAAKAAALRPIEALNQE